MKTTFSAISTASLLLVVASGQAATITVNPALADIRTSDFRYVANTYNLNKMQVWNEKSGYGLSAALSVDAVAPGTYNSYSDLGNHSIAAGTYVDSHMLYFDPKPAGTMVTTVSFSQKILGVIVHSDRPGDDRLLKSDYLAPAGSLLPGSTFENRGIEMRAKDPLTGNLGLKDWFSLTDHSISVDLAAGNPGDQIRVITEAVPEPTSIAVLSLGIAGIIRRRRKTA